MDPLKMFFVLKQKITRLGCPADTKKIVYSLFVPKSPTPFIMIKVVVRVQNPTRGNCLPNFF